MPPTHSGVFELSRCCIAPHHRRRMPRRPPDVLRVQGLSVRRGRTLILSKVEWRVRRGEHWVVLGANGSGKTSLLSVLTGYLTPTEGEIQLLGRVFGESDW